MRLDPEKLAAVVVGTIKSNVDPILARVLLLEQRAAVPGRDGRDGQSIVGAKGDTGPAGSTGERGLSGDRGADGETAYQIAVRRGFQGDEADWLASLRAPSDAEVVGEFRAEIAALKAEIGARPAWPDLAELSAVIASMVKAEIAAMPPVDVMSMVSAEVTKAISDTVRPSTELLVRTAVHQAVAEIPAPKDGRDGSGVTVDDVRPVILAEVAKAVALIPPVVAVDGKDGRDGSSVTLADVEPVIAQVVEKAVSALPVPKDGAPGASVDHAEVDAMVLRHVTTAVAAIPTPKDGHSVTVDDVAPLIASEVSKAVATIPAPKDGIGLTGAVLDREGHLVLTLSDGTMKDVGVVMGRDVDMAEVNRKMTEAIAAIPMPKDGADGRDGVGFDDIEGYHDDRGHLHLRFVRGEKSVDYKVPDLVDRGVWAPGHYLKGEVVSWGSSAWIAQRDTDQKPDGNDPEPRAWRMAVKRGGEGKPGINGKDGKNGLNGKDGNDRW